MKKLLALALVAVMASGAMAQEMGIFFGTPYTEETTNINVVAPFSMVSMYLVLLNGPVDGIRAFEAGMQMTATIIAGAWAWPTNFMQLGGTINNFQVLGQSGAFIPFNADGMLLGTFTGYYQAGGQIKLGPYSPPSMPCVPVLVDITGTVMIPCGLVIDSDLIDDCWGVVATINGEGVIATEEKTLSNVKALFQ